MPAKHSPHLAPLGPLAYRPRAPVPAVALTIVAVLGLVVGISFMMNVLSLDVAVAAGFAVALSFLCFVRIKWVLFVLIFACLFSPELQVSGVLGRAAKRAITIRVEDILLVVIAIAWFARAAVSKELGLMLRTPLNRPIFFYALVCIIATALGIGYGWVEGPVGAGLFVLKYIQYFVLFFMIVNHVETPRDVRNLVAAGVITYLVVCLYGLAQVPGGGRPTTFAEHIHEPNTLAGYLLFMMGICFGLLLTVESGFRRLGWGILGALGVILLAYTLSRSGWAGMIGVGAVLVFVGRRKFALVATLLTVASGLTILSFEADWVPDPIKTRALETVGEFESYHGMPPPVELFGMQLDPSASERFRSYEDALKTWFQRSTKHWVPIFTGSGVLGGKPFVDGQYVRVLAETGVLGLIAFVGLLVAIWRHVWRAYAELRTPWYRGLALGYLAGFAGLLVHAIGANTFIIVRIMEPFFIFTGIVVLLPMMERMELEETAEASEPV